MRRNIEFADGCVVNLKFEDQKKKKVNIDLFGISLHNHILVCRKTNISKLSTMKNIWNIL